MTAQSAVYHYKSCNGKIANPIQPNCTAVSPGDYGLTSEAGDKAAAAAGWTQVGNKDYCPMCSTLPAIAEGVVPARKRPAARTPKVAETPVESWSESQ